MSNPHFNSVAPCFAVPDVRATINWYEKELGFTCFPFPKTPPHVFAIMSRDGIEIMLQLVEGYEKPNLYEARAGGVWDAYVRMKDVTDFYEDVRDRVKVIVPLCQQPYGDWEFEVRDPNGYVLVFSELK